MNRKILLAVVVLISGLFLSADLLVLAGRGGRGGGGGGGGRAGGGGGGGGARPAPSRPAVGSGVSAGGGRPAAAPRPSPAPGGGAKVGGGGAKVAGGGSAKVGGGGANVGGGGAKVGGGGANVSGGGPKGGGAGPGAATRPSQGQLQNFLDVGGPGAGGPKSGSGIGPGAAVGAGIAAGVGAGVGQGAVNDFFNGPGPGGPGAGVGGPDIGKGVGNVGDGKVGGGKVGDGKVAGGKVGDGKVGDGKVGDKAGQTAGERSVANNRPERVENRQQLSQNRTDRRQEVRNEFRDNHPRFDWAMEHPRWASWRVNRPYRWAAAAALTGWCGYGAGSYYDYGENIYYQEGAVYSEGQQIATAEQYTVAAEQIATSTPPTKNPDWLTLGVFAITQDGQASGPKPTMFVQLNVSKEGIIAGSFQNAGADTTQPIEGMVDKKSQRAAWVISGKSRPIMETGIFNLTKDTAPALVHFDDGQTQQWLLVRLEEPKE